MRLKEPMLVLLGMAAACVVPAWAISSQVRNAFMLNAAYLRPDFYAWSSGFLLLVFGVAAKAIAQTRRTRLLANGLVCLGILWLFQTARCFASFEQIISYRSSLSLKRVEIGYESLERVEIEEACRGNNRYVHQVVLQFRDGRSWQSAVDGMLSGDDVDKKKLLRVIRARAPVVPFIRRFLMRKSLLFGEAPDRC